jgi:hypothetical protein
MSGIYEIPPAWRTRVDAAFALLSLVGAATPFLPFAYDVSPLSTFGGREFVLGAPFFSALIVSSMLLRMTFNSRATRVEVVFVGLCAGLLSVGFIVAVAVNVAQHPSWSQAARVLGFSFPLVPGLWSVVRLIRVHAPTLLVAVVALQWGYLAVAGFLLVALWRHWQLGALFTLVTVVIYLTQIAFVVARAGRRAAADELAATGAKT